jgi:hypothetical protein
MHSINVVLRNLQEMIYSDKWGRGEFHLTPITSLLAVMSFSQAQVGGGLGIL